MGKEVIWILYYRELLVKAVPETSSSISQCVLKGWLHEQKNTCTTYMISKISNFQNIFWNYAHLFIILQIKVLLNSVFVTM